MIISLLEYGNSSKHSAFSLGEPLLGDEARVSFTWAAMPESFNETKTARALSR